MLRVAISKGRVAKVLAEIGSRKDNCLEILSKESRKLSFYDEKYDITYMLVKPADLPKYLEYGAADIGIVGNDVLLESGIKAIEVMELNIGKCVMAFAGMKDNEFHLDDRTRIATKYPNITKGYLDEKGLHCEIIKLEGSVELAPVLGLSDVIVDIVETGATLEANGLVVYESFLNINSRLVSNVTSFRLKKERIQEFAKVLAEGGIGVNDKWTI